MNKKLSETTISLDLLQIIVDERTEKLTKQTNTDSLTNVANRRALYERGVLEFSRENRHKTDLSIIMLDCDFFKAINDKYGHMVGDKLLVHLCDICQKEIRDIDLLARFGGEEFIILLPDCNSNGANEIAVRIKNSLKHNNLKVNGKKIPVTVSMGITSASIAHKSFEELVNSADKAMYFAKDNGRNRIEIIDS
jgi:diguanylate cyclase (GGDEF)-like protein